MDYEQIGKFISEKRREKDLTQKELADKLGVTDRAVSKWERGIGCPDISLLEPLSEILGVSILELLHGKKLEKVKDENKVVLQVLKTKKRSIRIWKSITMIFLNLFLVMLIFSSIICLLPTILNDEVLSRMHVVLDENMSPDLNFLDLVFLEPSADVCQDINIGDIVAYKYFIAEEDLSTYSESKHDYRLGFYKVFAKNCEEETSYFQLKNNVGSVSPWNENIQFSTDNIEGKYSFKIPLAGALLYGYETGIDTSLEVVSVLLIIGSLSIIFIDIIQFKNLKKII